MTPEMLWKLIVCVMAGMSFITFTAYAADKRRAVRGKWRIPESRLLLLAFFGGAAGAFIGMLIFHHKTRKWKFRILVPLFLILQVIILFFFGYCADYYHADQTAEAARLSDDTVRVEAFRQYWLFDGPSEDEALIFYPGGKVEAEAYAPLLHELAAEGMDAYLVKMPFNLAFFGMERADVIIKADHYKTYYIGGHSLGGVAAAGYAADHPDAVDGLVLLAAYPAKAVNNNLNGLLVYGSEDHVLNLSAVRKAETLWQHETVVLDGGNHAGFGNYGEQKGDGQAGIDTDQQQNETVKAILKYVKFSH